LVFLNLSLKLFNHNNQFEKELLTHCFLCCIFVPLILTTIKIIALDIGEKRTGIAETDPLQIVASPLITIDTPRLFDYLQKYLTDNQVETCVVGLSYNLQGGLNPIHDLTQKLMADFAQKFPQIKIEYIDERFSSSRAQQAVLSSGIGKKQRRDKSLLDKIAAAIILQDYMASKGL